MSSIELENYQPETILHHSVYKTPESKGPNGHKSSKEVPLTVNVDELRQQIREQLLIFTNTGRGRRLVEHGRNWRDALAAISRFAITTPIDPESIKAVGEEAKTIFMNAWNTHPDLLTQQTIQELKSLVAQNPAALPIIHEELQRIGKDDLAAEFTER